MAEGDLLRGFFEFRRLFFFFLFFVAYSLVDAAIGRKRLQGFKARRCQCKPQTILRQIDAKKDAMWIPAIIREIESAKFKGKKVLNIHQN